MLPSFRLIAATFLCGFFVVFAGLRLAASLNDIHEGLPVMSAHAAPVSITPAADREARRGLSSVPVMYDLRFAVSTVAPTLIRVAPTVLDRPGLPLAILPPEDVAEGLAAGPRNAEPEATATAIEPQAPVSPGRPSSARRTACAESAGHRRHRLAGQARCPRRLARGRDTGARNPSRGDRAASRALARHRGAAGKSRTRRRRRRRTRAAPTRSRSQPAAMPAQARAAKPRRAPRPRSRAETHPHRARAAPTNARIGIRRANPSAPMARSAALTSPPLPRRMAKAAAAR